MKRLIVTVVALALVATPASAGGHRGCASYCAPSYDSCGPSVSYSVSYVEKEVITYQCQLASKDVEVTYLEASYETKKGSYKVLKPTWVKDTQEVTYYKPVQRKVDTVVTRCSYVPTTVCAPTCCGGSCTYTVCQPVTYTENVSYYVCDYVKDTQKVDVMVCKYVEDTVNYEYQECTYKEKKGTAKQYYYVNVPVKSKVLVPVYTPVYCAPVSVCCP